MLFPDLSQEIIFLEWEPIEKHGKCYIHFSKDINSWRD